MGLVSINWMHEGAECRTVADAFNERPESTACPHFSQYTYIKCALDSRSWWIALQNSADVDPNYINIGNASLIDKRTRRYVPIPPGGPLSDYVPFYFTPFSIMMYNIKTGYGGITRRDNRDIVMFVSSVHRLEELRVPFLFTNQHAYAVDTEFYDDLQYLREIDWPLLQRRDFKTDDNDPGKQLGIRPRH
jgi:hypothetical protein